MSTSQRPPEPLSVARILLPSIPNDVAVNILARVPRQYHSVLSAVSKPIRSAISSPHFFAVRSLLKCTESIPYLIVGSYSQALGTHDNWFSLYRNPNPNPINNNNNLLPLAPVPRAPLETHIFGSTYAVVGPKIYVIGGYTRGSPNWPESAPPPELSSDVWFLDCRYHTWKRGPSMLTPRVNTKAAVMDGKIYVFGGVHRKLWVKVLDPAFGCWEAIPGPLDGTRKCYFKLELVNGKIRIRSGRKEFRMDTAKKTWEVVPNEDPFPTWRSVEKFEWFDERFGVWKELKVVIEDTPKFFRHYLSLINMEDKLVLVFAEARSFERFVNLENVKVLLWCAEIDVSRDEDGNLWGQPRWLEKVPLLPLLNSETTEMATGAYNFKYFFKCLSVSI